MIALRTGRRELGTPLGKGYVSFFADMMSYRHPDTQLDIINTGIGGNTVEDLRSRWHDDVLSHAPDWLSIKIGINDCNRHLNAPTEDSLQSPQKFADIYRQILDLTRSRLPDTKLLLITPFYAGYDDSADSYRKKVRDILPQYLDTVRTLSKEFNTELLETQPLYDTVFKHQHPKIYFPHEPVHPNHGGHMMMADAVYNSLL